MHTADELDATTFRYRSGGQPVDRDDVMPAMTTADRLGVVMGNALDGVGAGNFILSCVTAFYDRLRATREDFFEYPDYYTFQATTETADYGMLDIWPEHKNVSVEPDADRMLQAVSDRAIDILLVPAGPRRTPDVEEVTLRSAERSIDVCYLYAPDGDLGEPEFSIRLPREPVEGWLDATADSVSEPSEEVEFPSSGSRGAYITQQYRRTGFEEALSYLPGGDV